MSSTSASPHFDHLLKIGALQSRLKHKATRDEAAAELLRYRDEGLILQQGKETKVATKKTKQTRAMEEPEPAIYTGQGILFAVIDDRENLSGSDHKGKWSTVDVISTAIEQALDAGHEDSEAIARFLVTSAFQHQPDRVVRFNSVLKAGDAVGAQIVRKLHNSYNELIGMADETEDLAEKKLILREASGFAEALNIVLSPFSVEDPEDPRLVNWDEVDRITAAYEKEQRYVIKERKGNPQ